MRVAVVATAICLSIVGLAQAQSTKAAIRVPTNIPAQPLGPALKAFAQERDLQVLYFSQTVRGMHTGGASGELTADEALTQLLGGTGLTYRYVDDKAVTILPAGAATRQLPATSDDPNVERPASKEGKTSSSDGFRMAQVDEGGVGRSAAAVGGNTVASESPQKVELQEVVVTAQKREERLLDVPVPVTAIDADSLSANNQLRLQDYYGSVPGLSLATDGFRSGVATVSIRGITTGGFGNPTVGITVDDVPYGSSTLQGGGIYAPDIDPSDLARVEVLRGPQGTLYGASSMGGLLKFVTVAPSTERLSGRLQTDVYEIHGGSGAGYGVRGGVNVPLSDTIAVRASGYAHHEPGYIQNVQTGQDGANRGSAYGGRAALLWQPTENLAVKLGALLQDLSTSGSSEVDSLPGLGDLQQSVIRGVGGYRTRAQVYSAVITDKVGTVDLTAVSGYSINSLNGSTDYSGTFFGSVSQSNFGYTASPFVDHNKTSRFTQELRLAMPLGRSIDWLLGAFYDHESSKWNQDVLAEDPFSGAILGTDLNGEFPTTYSEYAAFTDLTFHFGDRFDIQVGGRESRNKETYTPVLIAPLIGLNVNGPEQESTTNAFTYLATPRFRISPDLMVYARAASGYRPGGPNTPAVGVPAKFQPDKTKNYEVGIKGDVRQHALSFDASLYYIDWNSIQIPLFRNPNSFTDNGGAARSKGIELAVESRPLSGMRISAWVVLNRAELTEAFPPETTAFGAPGDRLPYSSRTSGFVSLDQDFPITDRVVGTLGASVNYVGDREGVFTGSALRQYLPSYTKADLRMGAKFDSWTLNIYANNVTDRRGLLSGGLGTNLPLAFNLIQPRTIGLAVARAF